MWWGLKSDLKQFQTSSLVVAILFLIYCTIQEYVYTYTYSAVKEWLLAMEGSNSEQ